MTANHNVTEIRNFLSKSLKHAHKNALTLTFST